MLNVLPEGWDCSHNVWILLGFRPQNNFIFVCIIIKGVVIMVWSFEFVNKLK